MQRVFEALSSTVRRKILAYLAHADLTAGEIASRFSISKPAVSQHLSAANLSVLLSQTAALFPDRPGLILEDRTWTWREIDARVDALVDALR
eukprot:gene15899-15711_t